MFRAQMRQGISVQEAREWIQGAIEPLPGAPLPLSEVLGLVLSESVISRRNLPPADCSAMDGYAVLWSDLQGAAESAPISLRVVFEVAAGGEASARLAKGEAARIFTGAPLPPGADTVVRQEDTERHDERVAIHVAPARGSHVRTAGEDIAAGTTVLECGKVLGPSEIGVLASLGRPMVPVHRRPRVAILAGGDELVELGEDTSKGQIVASNSYLIAAACRRLGADPVYLGISADDPVSVEEQFRAGMVADCLVSSAGVSVGDHDHVRPVLEKLGCQIEFWGVKMKPGYPLAFGRFASGSVGTHRAGPIVFGLPGNPVSAAVAFDQFVQPALLRMMGHTSCYRALVRARLGQTLRKSAGRLHFVRVKLEETPDGFLARSTGNQSSGVMTSMTQADGLMIFPEQATELSEGQVVDVQIINDQIRARPDPGF